MSEQDDFSRVFIWVLGLLVLFTIVVMLVARSVGLDENSGSMAAKDIDMRTAPYGGVNVAAAAEKKAAVTETAAPVQADVSANAEAAPEVASAPARAAAPAVASAIDGEALYAACAGCHDSGAAGAPKVGDKAEWVKRMAMGGESHLVENAIKGKGAMPPKGGRMDLSDAQIKAIVAYMILKSK